MSGAEEVLDPMILVEIERQVSEVMGEKYALKQHLWLLDFLMTQMMAEMERFVRVCLSLRCSSA